MVPQHFGNSALSTQNSPTNGSIDLVGVLAIAGACLAWGLDNNLSQRLSLADPVRIAQVKAIGASAPVLLLALALDESFPMASASAALLAIGMAAYGLSIVLDLHALRRLGKECSWVSYANGGHGGGTATPEDFLDMQKRIVEFYDSKLKSTKSKVEAE